MLLRYPVIEHQLKRCDKCVQSLENGATYRTHTDTTKQSLIPHSLMQHVTQSPTPKRKRAGTITPNPMSDDGDFGFGCRGIQSKPEQRTPVVMLCVCHQGIKTDTEQRRRLHAITRFLEGPRARRCPRYYES